MRIEHVGLQTPDAAGMAEWYVKHLGFVVKRASDRPVPGRFLADESGQVMLEFYCNPAAPEPDFAAMNPLTLHIAFVCSDVSAIVQRLTAAGATRVSGPTVEANGDVLAMLRDPWGLPLQLASRGERLLS